MNSADKSQTQASEPPLFVLRILEGNRAKGFFYRIPFIYAIGIQIVAIPTEDQWTLVEVLLRLGGGWVALILIWGAVEITLFKELRIYQDRIVKAWTGLGEREVFWAHAGLRGYTGEFGSRLRWVYDSRMKTHPIFNPGFPAKILPPFRGLLYNENHAQLDDVTRLNALLANLSGRYVHEFQPQCFEIVPFIKKEAR